MDLLSLYLSALLLGTAHALEPDHLAAVTTFIVRRPRPLQAAGFGARWALGHGTAIFLVGFLLLILGRAVPETWSANLDHLVGVAMVGLGIWTISNARVMHAHAHSHPDGTTHTHLHTHAAGPAHQHAHAATVVGLMHGLAGTGPAVALVPLISLRTPQQGALYLFLFGLGTALGMASYALLAGIVAGRLAGISARIGRAVTVAAGAFAVIVGVIWVMR